VKRKRERSRQLRRKQERQAAQPPRRQLSAAARDLDRKLTVGKHDVPESGVLYHYTDAEGLRGIVENCAVWATEFHQLNDRAEIERGEKMVQEIVADRMKSASPDERILLGYLGQLIGVHPPSTIMTICVASFSEEGDLLSQWRAYAKHGHGYALGIGFDRVSLPEHEPEAADNPQQLQAHAYGVNLMRCIYSEEQFRAEVDAEISRCLALIVEACANAAGESHPELIGQGVLCAASQLFSLIPKLKAEGFAEEREYRLVATVSPRTREAQAACDPGDRLIRFRTSGGGIAPYVPVSIANAEGRIPISRVLLGPALDMERSEHAMKLLLTCHGYDPTLVQRSVIPFRG
jgi:hypothetical protein